MLVSEHGLTRVVADRYRSTPLLILGLCLLGGVARAHTFVYVANYNNSTIGVYAEHDKGNLVASQSVPTPGGPESIIADPLGYVITADSLAHAVSAYRIDPADGRLARAAVRLQGPRTNPFSVTASPGGHDIYVANSGDSTVGIYRMRRGRGVLIPDGRVHEAPGAKPYSVTFTPNGRYAYVANFGNATIGMYRRAPDHAALMPLGLFHEPPGDGPYGLAVGPDGRFLYVADFRANVLLVLAIGAHGRLTLKDRVTEPFDHHPDSLVIDPSGRYLFVANTSANDISIFRINQADGRLTHVGHVPTGGYPFSLTLDTAARFVFAVNYGNSTISRYRLDRQSGLLTAIGTTPEASYADPYGITAFTSGAGRSPDARNRR
ncbi:hypothetical protein C4901_04065 [Acidiferrobacter sp. SPIII_3]|nr:hypothetical protein C4901_04065 [Acidiferrobacter sp. SPIII_3]